MQKSIGISVVVGIIIITAVMIYQFNETTWNITSTDEYYEKGGKVAHVVYPDNPQFLGPLQINKDKYLLGENIFVIIKNLQPEDTPLTRASDSTDLIDLLCGYFLISLL